SSGFACIIGSGGWVARRRLDEMQKFVQSLAQADLAALVARGLSRERAAIVPRLPDPRIAERTRQHVVRGKDIVIKLAASFDQRPDQQLFRRHSASRRSRYRFLVKHR